MVTIAVHEANGQNNSVTWNSRGISEANFKGDFQGVVPLSTNKSRVAVRFTRPSCIILDFAFT